MDETLPAGPKPIVAEVDLDGNKRLYKSRYTELERMYRSLYNRCNKAETANQEYSDRLRAQNRQLEEVKSQAAMWKAKSVDSEKLTKLINQLCKDLNIPKLEGIFALEDQVNHFLGHVMCMIRVQEEASDELAS